MNKKRSPLRRLMPLLLFGTTMALGFAALMLVGGGPAPLELGTPSPAGAPSALSPATPAGPSPTTIDVALAPTAPLETLAPPPTSAATLDPPPETAAPAPPTPTPEPALLATVAPSPTLAPPGELDEQLLELVNAFRVANGCTPMAADPLLRAAAQGHAQDLATHDLISHDGSDGATYSERLDRVGYPYQLRGENIAAGYRTPQEVMTMWTEGDEIPDGPHRLNILNCQHVEVGVGLAYSDDDYPYWVLDMASRRG